ncbi:hypothetical protein, partial [Candidatus Binatus sp.]|uniref:hypothetical protein n=1 Tax=Candidatus Binatus sp. TaxID=2811406 RepID=UPI003BB1E9F0
MLRHHQRDRRQSDPNAGPQGEARRAAVGANSARPHKSKTSAGAMLVASRPHYYACGLLILSIL